MIATFICGIGLLSSANIISDCGARKAQLGTFKRQLSSLIESISDQFLVSQCVCVNPR
jgi:hypothetical protein